MTLQGIVLAGITGLALSFNSIAGTMGPIQAGPISSLLPWVAIGSLGYTRYQNTDCEGQTGFGRFAVGHGLLAYRSSSVGLELGVQSGNTMRLDVSEVILEELGGVPIQTTVKPMLDLLATVNINPTDGPIFAQIKGGAAYRTWQFNGRDSVSDLSTIAGEVQTGLGYTIGRFSSVNLLYQRVFGSNPNFTVSEACPSGRVSGIPTQQSILLSFSLRAP